MHRILLISEQLYGALLRLYPAGFRSQYGRPMQLTFRDACRATYRRRGLAGLLALWLPTLVDLLKSALQERTRQGRITMSKERLIMWIGPLTMMVGALWLLASIGEFVLAARPDYRDTFWDVFWVSPFLLSFILMLPAFLGIWWRYRAASTNLGRVGLMLSLAGCGGMFVFMLGSILMGILMPGVEQHNWPNYVIATCLLSIMSGHILFGLDTLKNKLLPRWNVMPLLVGLSLLLSIVPTWIVETSAPNNNQFEFALSGLRFAITGLCWLLLGIVLAGPRQKPQAATAI